MPTLIVWGERDNTIPVEHGLEAAEAIPNSRFETLPRAAHFPNLEDPEGLAEVLRDWLDTTEPALIDDSEWGERSPAARARLRPSPRRAGAYSTSAIAVSTSARTGLPAASRCRFGPLTIIALAEADAEVGASSS